MKQVHHWLTILVLLLIITPGCHSGEQHEQPATQDRFPGLEGASEFRDMGGYMTEGGTQLKWGVLYRSGNLARITDQDMALMDSLHLTSIVNLLTTDEVKTFGLDRVTPATRNVHLPIDVYPPWVDAIIAARNSGNLSSLDPTVNATYHRVLVKEAAPEFARLYREIIRSKEALVFHCADGVHRTGTAAAILLWYLGVPWTTVQQDYLLSNDHPSDQVRMLKIQLQRIVAIHKKIQIQEVETTAIDNFFTLTTGDIDAVRDTILADYGSVEAYMTEALGLNAEELQQLRNKLLAGRQGS